MKDLLYPSLESKFRAVVKTMKERHLKGQPVLVGTVAVETSDYLSKKLVAAGIPSRVMNAQEPLSWSTNRYECWPAQLQLQLQPIWLVVVPILSWEGVRGWADSVVGTERHEAVMW